MCVCGMTHKMPIFVQASIYINELLYGKELEGKIVLRLGGILWLDPLVERVYLSESKAIINRSYVHVELVRNGFANVNPTVSVFVFRTVFDPSYV